MPEREFIERVAWDTNSIVDVAIDASVEVLRVEGNVGHETLRLVGQHFASVFKKPLEPLVINAPESAVPLLAFIPPSEFRVVRRDLDEDRPPAEARLLVFNPLSVTDESDYKIHQMHAVLGRRLREISDSLRLVRDDLELMFPREFYAKSVDYYSVPLLR